MNFSSFLKYTASIFLSVFFLAACSSSNSPENIAINYTKAMCAGETEKVIQMVDLSDVPAAQQEQAHAKINLLLKEAKAKIDNEGGLKSVNVTDKQIEESNATVKVTLETGSGKQIPSVVRMKKIDGQWKVSNL